MRQTAVEWLIEQLENSNVMSRYAFPEVIQQAKAMEKGQIKDAWDNGIQWDWNPNIKNSEEYYNETFKSE